MSKPAILPKKVYLPLVYTELDLNNTPEINKLEMIFSYMENDGLNLYFDKPLLAVKASRHDKPLEPKEPKADQDENDFINNYYPREKSKGSNIYGEKMINPSRTKNGEFTLIDIGFIADDFYQDSIHYYSLDENGETYHPYIDYQDIYCYREELLELIYKMNFEKKFIRDTHKTILSDETTVSLPSYLDTDHEYYSKELALAIELHKLIYEEKYGNPGMSRKDRVNSWLLQNRKDLIDPKTKSIPEAVLVRLSSVIGIKK